MKRIVIFIMLSCAVSMAQIQTPNLGLILPPHGAQNWDVQANGNFSILDTVVGTLQSPFQGTWNSAVVYSKGQSVVSSSILYYSLMNANFNNSPAVSPLFWSAAIAVPPTTASANQVYAGPTSGGAVAPVFRALVTGDLPTLPNPSPSTLGGIESLASVSHFWINQISTSGVPTASQPACTDLSGVAASCSTDTTNAANISSGFLPTARFQSTVNAQSGTTYTVADSDRDKLVTFNNASAIAVTLPQAGSSGNFVAGWLGRFSDIGLGVATITPTTSTIDGLTSISIAKNCGVEIISDGTNYFTMRGNCPNTGRLDLTGQTANFGPTTVFTPTVSGLYNFSCYTIITTVAGTSSTLVSLSASWTDADNSQSLSANETSGTTGNSLSTFNQYNVVVNAKAATAIQAQGIGYASNPAATMQYAVHCRVVSLQ